MKFKKLIFILGKYGIGLFLLHLAFKWGQGFDYSILEPVLHSRYMFLIVICKLISFTAVVVRWKIILTALQIDVSWKKSWSLSMVGLATSYLMPGALSGDLIKTMFLHKHVKNLKRVSISVLVDRLAGLGSIFLTLFVSMGIIGVTRPDVIIRVQEMIPISLLLTGLAIGSAAGFALGFFFWKTRGPQIRLFLLELLHVGKQLPAVLILSLLSQGVLIFSYYSVLNTMSTDSFGFVIMAFIFSFSSLAIVLPLTPGGLGVGQMAFNLGLSFFVTTQSSIGATLFTIFQIFDLVLIIPGLLLFFLEILSHKLKEEAHLITPSNLVK